ncbi:hypothetical protein T439DRAFT_326889 [Meredithblackwellia eburnea MCA 4105]
MASTGLSRRSPALSEREKLDGESPTPTPRQVMMEEMPTNPLTSTPQHTPILIGLLFATTLVGSYVSLRLNHHTITSFRSRLPVSTMNTSTIPSPLPYFADKRNLFNQLFVKYSWGWTTGVILLYTLALVSYPAMRAKTTTVLRIIRRYTLATFYWWFLTQGTWFFGVGSGPSVAHRVLLFTGAECTPASLEGGMSDSGLGTTTARQILSPPGTCSSRNGEYWKGGHDVSGHTFMMVHAILIIWEVAGPMLLNYLPPPIGYLDQSSRRRYPTDSRLLLAFLPVLFFIGIWWWMLLMTSLYFHTPLEKVTGFIFGLGGWWFSGL